MISNVLGRSVAAMPGKPSPWPSPLCEQLWPFSVAVKASRGAVSSAAKPLP